MKIANCYLKSVSPYSQSKKIRIEKDPDELFDDFEKRTWRERLHVDENDKVFIPPMQFSRSIKLAAKYLSIKIPGRGNEKYTKNFEASIMVTEPLMLNIKKNEVEGEWLDVPSDGRKGGSKRVPKCFPLIRSWEGSVKYFILDDIITLDVFERVIKACGLLIGLGRFRPINGGYYGRFEVKEIKWTEE